MNHNFELASYMMGIFGILGVASILRILSEKLKISYAVLLLVGGGVLYFLFQHLEILALIPVEFSPSVIFYVFLPTIIFESAYNLNLRSFRNFFLEISLLSTFGVVVSLSIVGFGLHYIFGIPLLVSLIFGTFISATDPVAVLSIFKELKVPKKLSTILDGESLMNDGTSLVLFQLFLAIFLGTESHGFHWGSLSHLFSAIFLGVLFGGVMGRLFSWVIANTKNKGVQIMFSIILAHATFLLAEIWLNSSGILATMTAGIIVGRGLREKINTSTKETFNNIWSFLEFVSNSFLFLLLGIKIAQIPVFDYWYIVLISIILSVFIARPLSVFASFFISNIFRKKIDKTPFSYQILCSWGGIRGILAATIVLLLPKDFPYLNEIYAMTTGIILATFFLKAMTISWGLKKFKVVQFSLLEKLQRYEAQILVNQKIQLFLKKLLEKQYIDQSEFEQIVLVYKQKTHEIEKLDFLQKRTIGKDVRENETILTKYALNIELRSYRRLFELKELRFAQYEVLTSSILRQIDRLEKNILPDEESYFRKYAPNIPMKFFFPKLFRFWENQWKTTKILDRYRHYRARKIASWQVLLHFEELKNDHFIFEKCDSVQKIMKRYKSWNSSADKKMIHVENQFPKRIRTLKEQILQDLCEKKFAELILEFRNRGFLTTKLFDSLRK